MAGGQNNSRLTQMVYPNGRAIDNPGLDKSISRLIAIADDNNGSPDGKQGRSWFLTCKQLAASPVSHLNFYSHELRESVR